MQRRKRISPEVQRPKIFNRKEARAERVSGRMWVPKSRHNRAKRRLMASQLRRHWALTTGEVRALAGDLGIKLTIIGEDLNTHNRPLREIYGEILARFPNAGQGRQQKPAAWFGFARWPAARVEAWHDNAERQLKRMRLARVIIPSDRPAP
jgi:hypothetical protein